MPILGIGSSSKQGDIGAPRILRNGHSLEFDGSDDYISIQEYIIADEEAFSFHAWIYPEEASAGDELHIAGYTGSSGSTADYIRWRANINQLRVVIDGTGYSFIHSSVTDSAWHHLVVTRGTDNNVRVYVDGTESSSGEQVLGGQFRFSKIGETYSQWEYIGKISDVAIWNTQLSDDDVSKLYNNSRPTNLRHLRSYKTSRTSNLKRWYRMGDSSNDDIYEVSSTHGVVDDASNPGLSTTNLLAAYPTTSDTWTKASEWTYDATNDRYLYDDTGTGAINTGSDISIAAATVHKLTFKIYTHSGSGATSPVARMHLADGAGSAWTGTGYTDYAGSASGTLHTVYFMNTGSEDTTLKFTGTNGAAGTTFGIGDIELYAFNGSPGILTNMASDDLVRVSP